MNKKIVFFSIIGAAIIVLGGLSPTIFAKDIKPDSVIIEVNRYYGKKSAPIYTEVSNDEAEEIKQILIQLNTAIQNSDEKAIAQYEKILNDKGIFGGSYQKFFSDSKYSQTMEKTKLAKYAKYFGSKSGDNISNFMCYFNAIGEGAMLWWLGLKVLDAIVKVIQNASNPFEAFILLLVLLPFLAITMLLTDLIPFRILAPSGAIALQNGSISSLGLMGLKRVKVGAESVGVNLSWFTGITINIPPINGKKAFLFVSGIALRVEPGT